MSQIRKPWTLEEDKAVTIIVRQLGTRKWSTVSQYMSEQYNLRGRTGKQCRQRWHNHLDPSINRKPWTSKQENIIFEAHRKYGNKWTDIAQLLQGRLVLFYNRTDNAVKNHFYSTIRRSLRRISKTLGEKNSTSQMRDVKPSVLSEIFHYAQLPQCQKSAENQNIVSNCISLSESILEFASLKSCVRDQPITQIDKQKLQALYENLMRFKEASRNSTVKKVQNQFSELESQSLSQFQSSSLSKRRPILLTSENYHYASAKKNQISASNKNQTSPFTTIKQRKAHFFEQNMNEKQSTKIINKSTDYDWDVFETKCQIVQSFALMEYGLGENGKKLWFQKIDKNMVNQSDNFFTSINISPESQNQH